MFNQCRHRNGQDLRKYIAKARNAAVSGDKATLEAE
jgi:hypothetical protein